MHLPINSFEIVSAIDCAMFSLAGCFPRCENSKLLRFCARPEVYLRPLSNIYDKTFGEYNQRLKAINCFRQILSQMFPSRYTASFHFLQTLKRRVYWVDRVLNISSLCG